LERLNRFRFARVFAILATSSLIALNSPAAEGAQALGLSPAVADASKLDLEGPLEYLLEQLNPPTIALLLERRGRIPSIDELLAAIDSEFETNEFDRLRRLETAQYQTLVKSNQLDQALQLAVRDSINGYESEGLISFELASGLFAIANTLDAKGDARRSELAFRACVNSLHLIFGPTHHDLATSWSRIAAARMVAGDFTQAERCARVSMEISRNCNDGTQSWLPIGLHNLGIAHGALGNLEFAERLLTSEKEHWRKVGSGADYQYANSLIELARIVRRRGELERAENLSRESLSILRRLLPEWSLPTSQCLSVIAGIRRDRGDSSGAESLFRDALFGYRKAFGPNHPQVAIAAGNLSLLLMERGELDESEYLLERTVQIHRSAGLRHLLAISVNNLAQLHALRGRDQEAEAHFSEAIQLFREMYGANDPRVAISIASLSTHLHRRGDFITAEVRAREALEIAIRTVGEQHALTANVRIGLASILQGSGNLGEADEQASRALELHEALTPPTHPRFAAALARLGSIRLDQGLFEPAVSLLLDAFDRLDQQRGRILGAERERALFAGRFELANMAGELISANFYKGDLDAAVAIAERRSGRALLDLVARSEYDVLSRARQNEPESAKLLESHLADEERARIDLFEAETEFPQAPDRDSGTKQVERARQALRQAEANVLTVLSKHGPDPRPMGTTELRDGLDKNEVLLYIVWAQPIVAVLAVPPGGDQPIAGSIIAATANDIEKLGDEARSLHSLLTASPLRRDAIQSTSELNDRLSTFGARLFPQPVLETLKSAERIVIVADGPLVGIPFDLLLAGNLDENHNVRQVSYSPSGTLHSRLQLSGSRRKSAANSSALIVGNPSFRNSDDSPQPQVAKSELDAVRLWGDQLDPLPGTRIEALGIAGTLREYGAEALVLLGEDATLSRLEESAKGRSILHLATHGLVGSPARPFDASLALASPKVVSKDDFGFLTLDRLIREWRGKLDQCELVVLSACDTNRGTKVGDSLMALPWGFFHAGAPTVIASLWRVDDVATALLMHRFYRNLYGAEGEPVTTNEALGEARSWLKSASRREIRTAETEWGLIVAGEERSSSKSIVGTTVHSEAMTPYADPYYWAGFVLIGDPN
jgi:CHAT domain-containing protein